MSSKIKARPVLVTTQHRGVFFGYLESKPGAEVTLSKARNCLYWPAGTQGFLGLATTGPIKGTRVGPAVATLTLYGVTSVSEVTADAAKAWDAATWNG